MKARGLNWKRIASIVSLVGVCQFTVLSAVSMRLYPGGNPFDREREGYAFWSNSLSDLGREVSVSGVANPVGSVLFQTSLIVATLGLGGMWAAVPSLFASRKVIALSVRALGVGYVVGMIAVASMFLAVQTLPVADATALLFSAGLFTVLFAAIALREAVGVKRWLALAVGFAGALIIIRPGFVEFSWASAVMMVSALTFGATNVFTRFLATTEDANAVVFYNYFLMGLLALPPALAEWRMPEWGDAPILLLLGVVTYFAQQSFTRSFVFAPPAIVMPAYYLQLPFAAVIAFFAFDEVPDFWVWVGAIVICGSTYYIMRADHRAALERKGDG